MHTSYKGPRWAPSGRKTDDLSRSWVWEQNNVTQRHGLFKKSPELLPGTGASTNAV